MIMRLIGWQSLVEVEVSEGLERIGLSAFINKNLRYINKLPSTLKVIGDCAFQGFASLNLRRIRLSLVKHCQSYRR
jgi:hypothetical protein